MAVLFYSDREKPYGCFSNFSAHGFALDGHYWKTSEHYFQAQKFVGDAEAFARVRDARAPKIAAEIGRDRSLPLRADWEMAKDDAMRRALAAKFETHDDIRAVLLATGEEKIVENAPGDFYWGVGRDGTGKNKLGLLLMELRAQLRGETKHGNENQMVQMGTLPSAKRRMAAIRAAYHGAVRRGKYRCVPSLLPRYWGICRAKRIFWQRLERKPNELDKAQFFMDDVPVRMGNQGKSGNGTRAFPAPRRI